MPSFSKPPFQAMVTICYENFNWIFSCQSPTLLYSRLHSTFHPIMVKSMIVGIYYYVDRLIFNRKVKHFFFLEGGGWGMQKLLLYIISIHYRWFTSGMILNIVSNSMYNVQSFWTHEQPLCSMYTRQPFPWKIFEILRCFFFAKPHFIFLLNSFSLFRLFKE